VAGEVASTANAAQILGEGRMERTGVLLGMVRGRGLRRLGCLLVAGLLTLGGFSAPSRAWAQDDKEETQIKAFERKKEERPKPEESKGPGYKGRLQELEEGSKGTAKRDEAIKLLRDLISSSDDSDPERPKYLFQLAEALWNKSKGLERDAFKTQDEMYAAQDRKDSAAAERLKRQMDDNLKQAVKLREQATEVYVEIINKHKDYGQISDVYFYLGVNLLEINKQVQALQIFRTLLQEYPNSPYTPNVLLAFGEYAFDNDDMEGAVKAYKKVLEYPDASVKTYAEYKLGWCYYNLTRYDLALQTFLNVANATSKGGKKDASLRKEALKDLVTTYSHIGKASKALPFFRKVVDQDADVQFMAERLAELYAGSGNYAESSDLYRELITLNKNSFKIVAYQLEIVRNTEPSQNRVEVVRELLRTAKLTEVASKFADAKGEEVDETKAKLEQLLREYATTYHREAQVTRNEDFYALSYELYRVYLDLFPQVKDRYLMTFFYAELLYKLKKYDEAAVKYEDVINLNPKGEYSEEAIHAAVLSYQKLIQVDEAGVKKGDIQIADPTKKPEDGKGAEPVVGPPKPREIPELKQKMIKACDRYVDIAPNAKDIVKVKYTSALVFYDYDNLDEAIKRFADIVQNHPNDRLALVAADLHLDSLYLKRDYDGLTKWVEEYRSNEALARGEFVERLNGIAERLQFQRCYDMEGRKEWDAAAKCFTQDFYRKFPDSPLLDKALYNAALDYERERQIGKAIQVRKGLLQLRPDSDLAKDTLFNIGGNYHAIAVYSEASKYYELFVQYFAKDDPKKSEEALRNAATFRQGLGQYEDAVKNYEQYLGLFSDKKDKAAEVRFQIAKIYDDEKKTKAAFDSYNDYLKNWAKVGKVDRTLQAHTRLGMIHWEAGRQKQALEEFQTVLKLYQGLREDQRNELTDGADAAAQARFMVGEVKLREMEEIKLKLPESLLQKKLQEKIKVLGEAREIYFSIFKFGRPDWTLAALYRIGYISQSFAQEIRKSPVPTGLTEEQIELYKGGLEEQATQIDQGAIEAYTECLNVSRQKSWFNEYSTKAEIALAGLQPGQYRKPSELRAQPNHARAGFKRAGVVVEAIGKQKEAQLGGEE
jgi:tetratricopeptide (TPR) repeat protein